MRTLSLALPLTLLVTTTFVSAPAGAQSSGRLPKWRLMAGVLTSDADPDVGIYRRIADRWDFGLQVGGSLSTYNRDDDAEAQQTQRTISTVGERSASRVDISLHSELRRWSPRTAALATFYGFRFSVSYADGESEDDETQTSHGGTVDLTNLEEFRRTSETVGTGFSLLLGADLTLIPHLSVTVLVTPLSAATLWSLDRQRTREDSYGDDERTSAEYSERSYDISFDLRPAVYLTLGL